MIEEAGHASMYEKPALFVNIVLGFVNQVPRKYIIESLNQTQRIAF